jgi:hypothetical protein
MKFAKAALILASILAVQTLTGCGGFGSDANANAANAASNDAANAGNTARTNVEELGLLVAMPYETEDAVWREDAGQKRIMAVLRFSPEDSNKLVEHAKSIKPPVPGKIESESWFPAELIAQSEMSGDDTLKGEAYAANDFFQPPYSEGRITRIENTDYFVLELTAK